MQIITSSAFGPFDPLNPRMIRGIFAHIVYAEPVIINAPVETVWEVMTDFNKYPDWNPLNRFFRLDSEAAPNHFVTFGPSWGPYIMHEGRPLPEPDMTQREMITIWKKDCCLAYADIRPYLKAERVQYISPLENSSTRYHTYERISGVLSPVVRWKFGPRIIAGFEANGLALRVRAESQGKTE